MKTVKCDWCGNPFEKTTNNMLYCCPECRYEATKKKQKIRRDEEAAKKPGMNQAEISRWDSLAQGYGLSYGKYEQAVRQGRIERR